MAQGEQSVDDAVAAAELIESLEDWFCQGAVTSRVAELLNALATDPAFGSVDDPSVNDDAAAHARVAAYQTYGEFIDSLLDHFVTQLVDDEELRPATMQQIATVVVAVVDSDAHQHLMCVPYIAAALDVERFSLLVFETRECMQGHPGDDGGAPA